MKFFWFLAFTNKIYSFGFVLHFVCFYTDFIASNLGETIYRRFILQSEYGGIYFSKHFLKFI